MLMSSKEHVSINLKNQTLKSCEKPISIDVKNHMLKSVAKIWSPKFSRKTGLKVAKKTMLKRTQFGNIEKLKAEGRKEKKKENVEVSQLGGSLTASTTASPECGAKDTAQ
jgi:hypothetical protein